MNGSILEDIVEANRADGQRGIYSVCSAHELVLDASLRQAEADGSPLLIEATCNQVNQDGGYTGMTPSDFRSYVLDIAAQVGFPEDRLVLGGDHLGPNPWTSLPAAEAMEKAKVMVVDYVRAGFAKIHLDASMACADDDERVPDDVIAERATELCAAAEAAIPDPSAPPVYIIGTEVPVPGGAQEDLEELATTRIPDLRQTIVLGRPGDRRQCAGADGEPRRAAAADDAPEPVHAAAVRSAPSRHPRQRSARPGPTSHPRGRLHLRPRQRARSRQRSCGALRIE